MWKFLSPLWELAPEQEPTNENSCMKCFLSVWVTQRQEKLMRKHSIVDFIKYMTVPSAWGIQQNYSFQKSELLAGLSAGLEHVAHPS